MTVKNQHYVPQSYLQYFANSKEQLWVYDTKDRKSFQTKIRNIASGRFFYDIEELDKATEKEQFIEKELFAKTIEPAFESLLSYIRTTYFLTPNIHNQNVFINEDMVLDIASHIIAQYMRTKKFRDEFHSAANQITQFMCDIIGKANFPEYKAGQVKLEVNPSWVKESQVKSLLNLKRISTLAEQLSQFIWIIRVNETEQPFLTSDNPIVYRSLIEQPDDRLFASSFFSEGTEITFPVSNKLIITMYEPTYFHKMKPYDRKFVKINSRKLIRSYNLLQVLQSDRQIFCVDDKFDIIAEMLKIDPNVLEEKAQPKQMIFRQL